MEQPSELELQAHETTEEVRQNLFALLDRLGKKIGEGRSATEGTPINYVHHKSRHPRSSTTTCWYDWSYCFRGGISAHISALVYERPDCLGAPSWFIRLASYETPVQEVAERIKTSCPEFEEVPIKR